MRVDKETSWLGESAYQVLLLFAYKLAGVVIGLIFKSEDCQIDPEKSEGFWCVDSGHICSLIVGYQLRALAKDSAGPSQ